MPSLRKRAARADPVDMSDGGAVPQPVVDAALEDTQQVADDVPPNDISVAQERQAQENSLQAQLDALRKAEEMHRQEIEQRQQQPPPPMASEAANPIELTGAEQELNRLYPAIMSEPAAANLASATIGILHQQGVARGSERYEQMLRPTFEAVLNEARAPTMEQPASLAPRPAPPTPQMPPMATAAPPPAPPMDEPMPEPRAVPYSAPVSRDPPSPSTGRRSSDTRVVLSAAEREHARLAGISEVEFARQKVRLGQMKQGGFYTEEG